MIVADVNPLVYAFRAGAPMHDQARGLLVRARDAGVLIVLPEVAAAFLRIVTDPRMTNDPDDPSDALAFIDALTINGRALREARASRWPVFAELVRTHDLRGRDVPDGLLAAAALDLRASLLTADRGFLRLSGLRLQLMTPAGVVERLTE